MGALGQTCCPILQLPGPNNEIQEEDEGKQSYLGFVQRGHHLAPLHVLHYLEEGR